MPRIPLIEELTTGPIATGTNLLVEFDPTSQWYNASLTIAAGWIKQGGDVAYNTYSQSPDDIRSKLKRLEPNAEELEKENNLQIYDCYTATLGQNTKEKYGVESLKVADMSIRLLKADKERTEMETIPHVLRIHDNVSVLARFNDEKAWVEFELTRRLPRARLYQSSLITSVMRGLHSDWVYKQLEGAVDGVIDFKLDETADPPRNLMRIRTMRNAGFDGRWHPLKIGENFEITLHK